MCTLRHTLSLSHTHTHTHTRETKVGRARAHFERLTLENNLINLKIKNCIVDSDVQTGGALD